MQLVSVIAAVGSCAVQPLNQRPSPVSARAWGATSATARAASCCSTRCTGSVTKRPAAQRPSPPAAHLLLILGTSGSASSAASCCLMAAACALGCALRPLRSRLPPPSSSSPLLPTSSSDTSSPMAWACETRQQRERRHKTRYPKSNLSASEQHGRASCHQYARRWKCGTIDLVHLVYDSSSLRSVALKPFHTPLREALTFALVLLHESSARSLRSLRSISSSRIASRTRARTCVRHTCRRTVTVSRPPRIWS